MTHLCLRKLKLLTSCSTECWHFSRRNKLLRCKYDSFFPQTQTTDNWSTIELLQFWFQPSLWRKLCQPIGRREHRWFKHWFLTAPAQPAYWGANRWGGVGFWRHSRRREPATDTFTSSAGKWIQCGQPTTEQCLWYSARGSLQIEQLKFKES